MRAYFKSIIPDILLHLVCVAILIDACNALELPQTSLNPPIPYRAINKITHIRGGYYSAPYVISIPNTEYILDSDISAAGTAIAIRASKVVLNLNGKTITYNKITPGEGVTIDAWNLSDIAIINGSIFQGGAMSDGDEHGAGNNPIKSIGNNRLYIYNVYARYGGSDISGFKLPYVANSIIEESILEDVWTAGRLKNRHQGVDAIQATAAYNIVRNNTIINARHRGISIGNFGEVYGNKVFINSVATNSYGIFGYRCKNVNVYDNYITGRGEHPIGIGFVASGIDTIEIHNNTIDVQTTRLGDEYGGNPNCMNPSTPCGNYAVGFRTTWGGNKISFHDNRIIVRTDSAFKGTHSATGKPVVVNAKGRGLMVAVNAGESSRFYNNTITLLDKDGSGKAFGIACTGGNAGEMIFEGNTVTSNVLNVALGDEYGACGGHPLFIRNTFARADNYPSYSTVASELGGYFEGTGRFVSNAYRNGASQESITLNASGKGSKSVFFGRELTVRLQTSAGAPLGGAEVKLDNGGGAFDATATTAADGTARLTLYDYELHNRNSTAEQTRRLTPHSIRVNAGGDTLTSIPAASPLAWDALKASGTYELPLYRSGVGEPAGKLIISY